MGILSDAGLAAVVALLAACSSKKHILGAEPPATASPPTTVNSPTSAGPPPDAGVAAGEAEEQRIPRAPASGGADPPAQAQPRREWWLATPGAACGVQLWDVKTASDPFAGYIDPSPHPTTIAELVSLPHPHREAGARINGVETTTWVLTNVTFLGAKVESDQDYHVVVGDADGLTMIVEIPSPACLGSGSALADGIALARSTFEAHLAGGSGWSGGVETISVSGVGFFDHEHRQTGAAFNQIEIHPVTAICFGRDCKLEGATPQPQTEEQRRDSERRAALQADVDALCRSRNSARKLIEDYQRFLSSCRGAPAFRSTDCTEENARSADAEVQAAITQAHNDENQFLPKWGSEAFVGIACH